jgi:hypothetical protein
VNRLQRHRFAMSLPPCSFLQRESISRIAASSGVRWKRSAATRPAAKGDAARTIRE